MGTLSHSKIILELLLQNDKPQAFSEGGDKCDKYILTSLAITRFEPTLEKNTFLTANGCATCYSTDACDKKLNIKVGRGFLFLVYP